jgi:hypothetical protein
VEISKEELEQRFRAMCDEELLGRLERSLTPLALEVLTSELRRRGIDPQQADPGLDEPDSPEVAENGAGGALVTVAEFWNPLQASLARAHLESCGIIPHVWNEHLGVMDLLFAVASGGIRLQVPADQAEEAMEILSAVARGDFERDNPP